MFAKVAEAQSQIESEIVVKDTTADQSKAGERDGDVAQSGTSGESTGGPGEKQNLDEQLAKIRMELSEDIEKGLAEVEREGDKIIVRLAEQGSFRSGFADIQPDFSHC